MAQIKPINLDVLDPPILEETNFGNNMDMWLTNIVDIINASFAAINDAFANLIAVGQVDAVGAGATRTVAVTGLLPGNFVAAQLISSTNAVTIDSTSVTAPNAFDITFSSDPGVSAVIAYQAFTVSPQ